MPTDPAFWRDLEAQFRSLRDASGLLASFSDGKWTIHGGPRDKPARDRLHELYRSLAVRGAVASGTASELDGVGAWLNMLRFHGTGFRDQDVTSIDEGAEFNIDPGGLIQNLAQASADHCKSCETRAYASNVVNRTAGPSSFNPFRMQDIDLRLLRPLRDEVVAEMQSRSAAVGREVNSATRQSGNVGGFWTRFFDAHEAIAEEWAGKLYAAHREAWKRQGESVSPAFIRAVRDQVILPLVAIRQATVQGEAMTIARRNSARPDPAMPLRHWAMQMQRLTTKWRDKLEAEAVELEFATARARMPRSISASGSAATAEDDPNNRDNWSPLRQRFEAFRKMKDLVTGPREGIPELLVREVIAEQNGIKPEDVSLRQIRFEVSGLLQVYPAIELIPSQRLPAPADGDDGSKPEAPHAEAPAAEPAVADSARSEFVHSRDFRSVTWDGKGHSFTSRQAIAFQILHESWKTGAPEVGQDRVLEDLGAASISKIGGGRLPSRLRDLFRGHAAWGSLIVRGSTRGSYRLALAEKRKRSS